MIDDENATTQPTKSRPAVLGLRVFKREDVLIAVLLIIAMITGAYFRTVGLNWDEHTHLHPDERFLTQVMAALDEATLFPTGSPDDEDYVPGYFDTYSSRLNPNNVGYGFYVYGTLPIFTVKAAAAVVADMTDDPAHLQYGGIHLVGRAVSAVADMLTILVIFFIGRRLYNKWVGLLASVFYAAAVLPIQLSHFATVDAFTTLMVTLTMWCAVRVLDEDRQYDYIFFGLCFGASMASRINVLPLAGVLVLAVAVRALPAFELETAPGERWRILGRAAGLLVLAAVVSFAVFRVTMPYAFTGPNIYNIGINDSWMTQMESVRGQVSGQADFPPNHQWASRTPYIFALQNIIHWGMGIPLGVLAWLGWGWGMWRVIRGRRDWTRPLLPAMWILVYFGWQGRQWVMSMRYYVILYPMLCIFAAWALLELLRRARNIDRPETPPLETYERPVEITGPRLPLPTSRRRRVAVAAAASLIVAVLAITYLYAYGFTGIYRRTFTRVEASRWFRDSIPGDLALYITADDGTQHMVNMGVYNRHWQTEDDEILDSDAELIQSATSFDDAQTYPVEFTAPVTGTVKQLVIPHLGDPQLDPGTETFRVTIAADVLGADVLGQGVIVGNFADSLNPLGEQAEIEFDAPIKLEAGQHYFAILEVVEGGPVTTAGAIIATEGQWDDPIPYSSDGWDGFGLGWYQGLELWMNYEDAYAHDLTAKRDIMLYVLDHTDYITISSNRFYDSLSRIPTRWPMTIRYYQALFSGELGYELAAGFYSFPSIGPIEMNDRWAEEAFNVYDHPIVMVFRRTEDYDPQRAREILGEVDLQDVLDAGQPRADKSSEDPTQLQLPDELWSQQTAGGTWSDRYDSEGPLSKYQWLAVVVWWLLVMMIGWAAFPVLFAVLPGLPGRGYPLAKVLGLVVVGWLPWLLTNLGLPLWNGAGVTLAFVLLAMLGMALAAYRWQEISAFVRQHWRRLLVIELITLGLFLFFLYVRAGNPDLWHQHKGGEKPMDFAYFNAVLRSTEFPPLDPWYAGGYINYYYFGYVIVGAPVLMLHMVPSLAYNLIVAMLYAMTGIGAFSLAFDLVAGLRGRKLRDGFNRWINRCASPWVAGIAALVMAVIVGNLDTIRVIGGGLATLGGWSWDANRNQLLPSLSHVIDGIGEVFKGAALPVSPHHWYWRPSRVLETYAGNAINEFPYFTFLYGDLHAHMIAMPITLLALTWMLGQIQGVEHKRPWWLVLIGLGVGALVVSVLDPTNRWDWITYLLLAVVALTFVNVIRLHRQSGLSVWRFLTWSSALDGVVLLAVGAFVMAVAFVAVLTNDFPTFITLALVGAGGLAALSFLRVNAVLKRVSVRLVVEVLVFVGLALLAVLPFNQWFGTAFDKVEFYESGDVTPLWAYIDMHGLFLFIVASLLIWETVVWLRRTRAGALRGKGWMVAGVVLLIIVAALVTFYLAFVGLETSRTDEETGEFLRHHYMSLLASVPLLVWTGLLFLRPGQGREKRVVLVAIMLALAITIGVEFVVLSGDIGRQNTIFKFYIQVWLLFSVAGGAAVAWLWRAVERWSLVPRTVWTAVFAVLVMLAALFPFTATRGKFIDRMSHEVPLTLDGMDYMQYATHGESDVWFSLAEDYAAIRWLQENVEGTPVVLEAHMAEYHWGARISIYTGMPTVLGWNWHQRQQRGAQPLSQVWERAEDIGVMYNTSDINAVWSMLREYDVTYVVVGALERATYEPAGIAKFEQMAQAHMLRKVYQSGEAETETVIYEVVG